MNKKNKLKPDWTPENHDGEFAINIVKGVEKKTPPNFTKKNSGNYSIEELVNGVSDNNRAILAKVITIIESNSVKHHEQAKQILRLLLPKTKDSLRIGITGIPGAGKSTLIESLGLMLIGKGLKVAVLSVDPSSSISKGSILGDKTRMEKLSRESNCFIRPSPSGGNLGGVARKTMETITICEAAGYDVILIETVGVGQSEVEVRNMVDFFLLVLIAGAGDELQGIKKGIVELADSILINKSDGGNAQNSQITKQDFENAVHYTQPFTAGWTTKVLTASALNNVGIKELWNTINEFTNLTKSSGLFSERRKTQALNWTKRLIEDGIKERFYSNPRVKEEFEKLNKEILKGNMLPTNAAEDLLSKY